MWTTKYTTALRERLLPKAEAQPSRDREMLRRAVRMLRGWRPSPWAAGSEGLDKALAEFEAYLGEEPDHGR